MGQSRMQILAVFGSFFGAI